MPLVLGLVALLCFAIGGAWYLRTPHPSWETAPEAEVATKTPEIEPEITPEALHSSRAQIVRRLAKELENMQKKGLIQLGAEKWITPTDPNPPQQWISFLLETSPKLDPQALHEAMPGSDPAAETVIYRALLLDAAPWSGDPTRIRLEEELQRALATQPSRTLESLLVVAPRLDRTVPQAKSRAYELAISLASTARDQDRIRELLDREMQLATQEEERLNVQSLLTQLNTSQIPESERSPAQAQD
jgi:hypothetical protein